MYLTDSQNQSLSLVTAILYSQLLLWLILGMNASLHGASFYHFVSFDGISKFVIASPFSASQ